MIQHIHAIFDARDKTVSEWADPRAGLKLTNRKIMNWAKVGCPKTEASKSYQPVYGSHTNWARFQPIILSFNFLVWKMGILSVSEIIHASKRSRIFISSVLICSSDLHTRDVHRWNPAQVRLPNILKPETIVPWMARSPCVWSPNMKNKYHGQTLSYDSLPSILRSRSSAILRSRGSAIREISFWLISQQRCLAAMQPVF